MRPYLITAKLMRPSNIKRFPTPALDGACDSCVLRDYDLDTFNQSCHVVPISKFTMSTTFVFLEVHIDFSIILY
jgi:hypothetical protein